MKTEFNKLVKTMQKYDLYQQFDEVDIALIELHDKIIEVEKRMECIEKCAEEINEAIGNYTELVDNNETFVMSVKDHDSIMRGSHDIEIALNLNDTEVIENNWYDLFVEPKKTPEVSNGGVPYQHCHHCSIKEEETVMSKANNFWLCSDCKEETNEVAPKVIEDIIDHWNCIECGTKQGRHDQYFDGVCEVCHSDMENIKKKDEIESLLIDIFDRIGIETPSNYEDIVQFVFEDVCETADPVNWNNDDVAIGFRRWIELK